MIVDVFPFDDEFDVLACRLYELRGVVDRFIVVEGDHTFTGEPKPYRLSENTTDLDITVIRVETGNPPDIDFTTSWTLPSTRTFWARDAAQRNAASQVLDELPDDTFVLFGDVDEIPRRDAVKQLAEEGEPHSLIVPMCIYSLSYVHPNPWCGTVAAPKNLLHQPLVLNRNDRGRWPPVFGAGWHLSWFGTPEDRMRKMRHFSHLELRQEVGDRIGVEFPHRGLHVDGRTELLTWMGDVPQWVADGHAPASWTMDWR